MPGFNLTGRPNTQDYILGKGKILLADINESTGLPDVNGFRDVGNTPSMNITVTVEDRRHKNSRDCLAFTDARFIVSQEIGLAFTLDEINFENLSDFVSGSTETYDNPHDVTHVDDSISTAVKLGRWYELRKASGARVYNLDAAGVAYTIEKDDAPDVLLVEGTDYLIDEQLGMVFFLKTAVNIAEGDAAVWTITTGASTPKDLDQVNALERSKVEAAMLFIQENSEDCGQKVEYRFHKVSLTGDGDLAMIGDEEMVMSFSGVAEVNSLVTDASQVLTVRTYDMV